MSYKALLFCPDERTAKVVTQVLSELDFQVEVCNEPFSAVKKLMAGHFDAVVVDCDNEQNATLLFKTARNSEFNQASLSVAVVEGQSGVAKAFRIGANLVLTKPINVEQSKGTLRVARGLLRKNENAKPAGTTVAFPARPSVGPATVSAPPISAPPISSPAVSASTTAPVVTPKPAFLTHAAPPLAPAATASFSSAFELEKEPAPEPEPAEAALLESMPDPAHKIHIEGTTTGAKQYPWQSAAKPQEPTSGSTMPGAMTTALKHAAEATGRVDSGISVGHGAAVAPAKSPVVDDEISPLEEEESAVETTSSSAAVAKPQSNGSSVNWGRIAAIIFVAAALGAIYRAESQLHWRMPQISAWIHQAAGSPSAQVSKPVLTTTTPAPSTPLPANQTRTAATTTAPAQKPSPSAVETIVLGPAKKSAVPSTSFDPPTPSEAVKTFGEVGANTILVDTQTRKPAPPKPVAVENVEPAAPDAVSTGSNSDEKAISGLASLPTDVPQPGPQTLKISQGVSQGLLIKKVAPVYPPRAMQSHLQGAVQLLATIGKDGSITHVKVLSGESMLARAALDAVKQWKYKPYLLDSQPMEIQTQITVNFTLP